MSRVLCGALAILALAGSWGCGSGSSGSGPGGPGGQIHAVPLPSPDALRRMSPTARAAIARSSAALLVLTITGYPATAISAAGPALTISLPADHACGVSPVDQNRITTQLKQAMPFIHKVNFTVAGTDESLLTYLENCISETLTVKVL
jgi:hypothetical protein